MRRYFLKNFFYRKAYNLLEKQTEDIQTEIKGKTCAITIDQRCLELRNELLAF